VEGRRFSREKKKKGHPLKKGGRAWDSRGVAGYSHPTKGKKKKISERGTGALGNKRKGKLGIGVSGRGRGRPIVQ